MWTGQKGIVFGAMTFVSQNYKYFEIMWPDEQAHIFGPMTFALQNYTQLLVIGVANIFQTLNISIFHHKIVTLHCH